MKTNMIKMSAFALVMTAGLAFASCSNPDSGKSSAEPKPAPAATTEAQTQPAEEHHKPNMNAEALEPFQCGEVQRLHTMKGVFMASQPQPADFEQAKMGGIELVVNMRHDSEIKDFHEQTVVEGAGLKYIHLPWNGADELTDEIITESRRIFREEKRPMLVHCSSGNRVGAVWMAYRVLDEGVAMEEALKEAKMVGMKTPAYETKIKAYLAKHSAK